MAQMTEAFVADLHHFVAGHDVALVHFAKGQRKDDVAHEYLAGHDGTEGVLFVGRAQEKARVISHRETPRPGTGDCYPWIVKPPRWSTTSTSTASTTTSARSSSSSAPTSRTTPSCASTATSRRKRQAAKDGIAFERAGQRRSPRSTTQPRCRRSATALSPTKIDALLRKWLAQLPHPFTAADRAAGYRYDISILQAEFSLTQVLDRPVIGRIFFEQVIRDNLDIGRPDQVQLIFDRRSVTPRAPPAGSAPGCITDGVIPEPARRLQAHPDQAVPQGRAARCAPRPPSTTPATSASANG